MVRLFRGMGRSAHINCDNGGESATHTLQGWVAMVRNLMGAGRSRTRKATPCSALVWGSLWSLGTGGWL